MIRARSLSVGVLGLVAVAGAVALAVSLTGQDASLPAPPRVEAPRPAAEAPPPPATRGLSPTGNPVAQTYSAYCQTQQGVCVLPSAQPIGSTCTCPDGSGGRVIP